MNAQLKTNLEVRINETLEALIAAKRMQQRREIGELLTDLIRERNALRTPGEIAALEADKGLG